jgi:uncharacterized protein YjlB
VADVTRVERAQSHALALVDAIPESLELLLAAYREGFESRGLSADRMDRNLWFEKWRAIVNG